jgi:hypothetical protein
MVVIIQYELFEEETTGAFPLRQQWKKIPSFSPTLIPTPQFGLESAIHIIPPVFEPCFLAAKHPHPLDATIRRSEDHKYYVRWFITEPEFHTDSINVSDLYKAYFPKFVPHQKVIDMRKDALGLHVGKYRGMTSDQVLQQWDIARNTGTNVHAVIEAFLNGFDAKEYYRFKVFGQFLKWYQRDILLRDFIPFRTEMKLRSNAQLKISGTLDALFISKHQLPPDQCDGYLELIMVDWKYTPSISTEAIARNFGFGICSHLADCKKWHYSIQQHLYKWMLESGYGPFPYNGYLYRGVKILSMILLVLHESLEEAVVFPVADASKEVQDILAERLKQVA